MKKVQAAQQQAFKQADQAIEKLLRKDSKEAGIEGNIDRCKALEEVGEWAATGLATTFMRGDFANSDAFIAFLGMDLEVDDSGKKNAASDQKRRSGGSSPGLQRRNVGVPHG